MPTIFEGVLRGEMAAPSLRPAIVGTRHMIAAGHYLASHAGFEVLEAGGNAVDAGVAAGLVLGVVQSELVNFAGVAPIMIHLAERNETVVISGLGTWPSAVDAEYFRREHGGAIPESVERVVVPAAPDAWITALRRFGTMSFGEVAGAAIRFSGEGFVMYPRMAELIAGAQDGYRRWPQNAEIYLPGGQPPKAGDLFVQADLARTLQYLVDEEHAAAGQGREAGLNAARDAFYKGDIAERLARYHAENGGFMTRDDLAGFSVEVESPVRSHFRDMEIHACRPWCQGPALGQTLNILDGIDLAAMGHNSPAYIHHVTEALKLAFADRHHHYGDPRFVEVPLDGLMSSAYAALRRDRIDPNAAWPDMPPAGDPLAPAAERAAGSGPIPPRDELTAALDTSYVAVIDKHGNAFSATPSDTAHTGPVLPGTGLCPSTRGSQGWTEPDSPAVIEPGKRPRLTPNPAMAIRPGKSIMPFGTPGGDVQVQAPPGQRRGWPTITVRSPAWAAIWFTASSQASTTPARKSRSRGG